MPASYACHHHGVFGACLARRWLKRAAPRLGLPPDVLRLPHLLPRVYVIHHHIPDADFPRYYKVRPRPLCAKPCGHATRHQARMLAAVPSFF